MVYALDPRIHRVWRTPDILQFGIDRPRLILQGVSTAEERMLAALDAGATLPGLQLSGGKGTHLEDVRRFLERVAPVLAGRHPAPTSPRVVVDGEGETAGLVMAMLRHEGAEVRSGLSWDDPFVEAASAAVIIAGFAVPPERHRRWLQRDIPHLPVVFGDDEVRIGPFVQPQSGPCLVCVDLTRTDEDADWPAMASRLFARPPRRESPLVASLAASAAALALLRALREGGSDAAGHAAGSATSISVDYATGHRTERVWSVHPGCGCRGLTGLPSSS